MLQGANEIICDFLTAFRGILVRKTCRLVSPIGQNWKTAKRTGSPRAVCALSGLKWCWQKILRSQELPEKFSTPKLLLPSHASCSVQLVQVTEPSHLRLFFVWHIIQISRFTYSFVTTTQPVMPSLPQLLSRTQSSMLYCHVRLTWFPVTKCDACVAINYNRMATIKHVVEHSLCLNATAAIRLHIGGEMPRVVGVHRMPWCDLHPIKREHERS